MMEKVSFENSEKIRKLLMQQDRLKYIETDLNLDLFSSFHFIERDFCDTKNLNRASTVRLAKKFRTSSLTHPDKVQHKILHENLNLTEVYEKKDSNNIESSNQPDLNLKKIIQIPPTNSLYFSINNISIGYKVLVSQIKLENFVSEGWDPITKTQKFIKLLCCRKKEIELELNKEQELFKFFRFSNSIFSDSQELHKNIFFSYFCRITHKNSFEDTPETWKILGFSSANYRKNELSYPNSLVSLLYLIFLLEHNPSIFGIFKLNCENFKFPFIFVLLLIINEGLTLLRRKKLNAILLDKEFLLDTFFEFIGGTLIIWTKILNKENTQNKMLQISKKNYKMKKLALLEKGIFKAFKQCKKSPQSCLEIFH